MKPSSTSHVLRSIFSAIGSSHRVDHAGYLKHDVLFPNTRQKSRDFAIEYFGYNIARKRTSNVTSPKLMRTALTKWSDSEWRCSVVNHHGRYYSPIGSDIDVFNSLKRRVALILSDLLCDVWPDLSELNFTSGSSSNLARKYNWSSSKADGSPPAFETSNTLSVTCINSVQDILAEMLTRNPGIARRYHRARWKYVSTFDCDDVDFNDPEFYNELAHWLCSASRTATLDYVPKDIKEVRLIAKSSSLTIAVQKTVGDAIRKALKGVNIDLNDQTCNQEWAEIGSLTGLVATVDLSAASDSISIACLKYFPARWQEYFMTMRDTHVSVHGCTRKHKLAMVAGMGNGYIFELESALFYAFSRAVTEELGLDTSMVSVYGDDIIIPSAATDLLSRFFLYNGFLINNEKSYSGMDPFRESCGKHYHNGLDVTPVYLKGDLQNNSDYFHLINGLREWGDRIGQDTTKPITVILNHVPPKERFVVPTTWSSRSGLYHVYEACRLPRERYDKRLQTYVTTYELFVETSEDVTEQCGESHQLTAGLIALETATNVFEGITCPPLFMRRALSKPLYEWSRGRITWKGEGIQQQKRRETVVRDA